MIPAARRRTWNARHFVASTVLTALLNQCRYRDPTVFPAWEVLRVATIEGAWTIGLGDELGSLEASVSNLVYVGSGHKA